jgi:hypothetical protein
MVVAAVLVVVLVAAPVVVLRVWPGPAPATDRPTLPSEFAAYSTFTSHVEDRPAGRAIALYEMGSWELSTTNEALVAGADRDSYRQIYGGRPDLYVERPLLLSPDGNQVIRRTAGGRVDELEVLDLRTGQASLRHGVKWTPLNVHDPQNIEDDAFLAWSPDSRYVAYAVHAPRSGDFDDGPSRMLVILDVIDDRAVVLGTAGVVTAAFAPDSRRIAVATLSGGIVLSVDGQQLGTFPDPTALVPQTKTYIIGTGGYATPTQVPGTEGPMGELGMAWSPDGTTLAVATSVPCPSARLTGFVDMTTGQLLSPQPPMPCMLPLGWRSPTVLIGERMSDSGEYGIAAASLVDGSVTPLARFDAEGCYVVSNCDVWRIQLATNLLTDVGVRGTGNPDRGPWVDRPRWTDGPHGPARRLAHPRRREVGPQTACQAPSAACAGEPGAGLGRLLAPGHRPWCARRLDNACTYLVDAVNRPLWRAGHARAVNRPCARHRSASTRCAGGAQPSLCRRQGSRPARGGRPASTALRR